MNLATSLEKWVLILKDHLTELIPSSNSRGTVPSWGQQGPEAHASFITVLPMV